MPEKMKAPAIRYAEFIDAWEQRKLGEICSTFTDGDWIEAKDQSNNGIRLLQTGNVGINEYLDKTDRAKWISEDTFTRLKCTEVFPGDILISRLPEPAGRACIVPNTGQKMITAVDCTIVRTSEKCASEFLAQHLSSATYFETVNDFLAGGTRQRISRSNLAKFAVPLPSISEQRKIGAFFTSLCDLITLHQREYDKTVSIKKALLEKMFPKGVNDKPEIRFAGFTDAWEQRKLGEFYFFKNGLNKGREYFGKGTPIVNFTDVFHNRGLKANQLCGKVMLDDSEIKNFEVRQGDIFFTRTSETIDEIGYPSVMLDEPKSTVFSGFVLRGRAVEEDPVTNIFKRYVFFTEAFRNEMVKKSSMTTRALTSGTAIKEMHFNFPASKDEQNRIGGFFADLDHLITLHQREYHYSKKRELRGEKNDVDSDQGAGTVQPLLFALDKDVQGRGDSESYHAEVPHDGDVDQETGA